MSVFWQRCLWAGKAGNRDVDLKQSDVALNRSNINGTQRIASPVRAESDLARASFCGVRFRAGGNFEVASLGFRRKSGYLGMQRNRVLRRAVPNTLLALTVG